MSTGRFYLWSSFTQIYDFVSGSGYWMYTLAASFLWVSNWPASLHLALTFPTPLPTVTRHPWLAWALYPLSYAITCSTWSPAGRLCPAPWNGSASGTAAIR